jgi:hypothetical protein
VLLSVQEIGCGTLDVQLVSGGALELRGQLLHERFHADGADDLEIRGLAATAWASTRRASDPSVAAMRFVLMETSIGVSDAKNLPKEALRQVGIRRRPSNRLE